MIDLILTMLEENSTNTILFMTLAILGLVLSVYLIVSGIVDWFRHRKDDDFTF